MPRLPINYPDQMPEWLDQWPGEQELKEVFSEGIRRYCFRVLEQDRIAGLDWTEDRLSLSVGQQQAVWRLVGREWRRNCTCGYVNDRCVHLYAAARVFEEVLREKQWGNRGRKKPIVSGQRSGGASHPQSRADARPVGRRGRRALVSRGEGELRLEVEVDFHHVPGKAGLRFYVNDEGRRHLCRMQQVLNAGLRMGDRRFAEGWSRDDRRFLKWLASQIRSGTSVKQNLEMHLLPERQFAQWLERWEDVPGRFIERATQEAIASERPSVRMRIELEDQGEWVTIVALVITPTGNRYPVHEVLELLQTGQRDVVLDGQMLQFDPPLSWELIGEVFSRRSPRMRRVHISEHLPNLLEGRLDLVSGRTVKHRDHRGKVRLHVSADGADVLIASRIGSAAIRPDSSIAAGAIAEEGRSFVITTYTSPFLDTVREFLIDLEGVAQEDARARIAGQPKRIAEFVRRWRELPEEISRTCDAELEALLGDGAALVPTLAVEERGSFLQLAVGWQCGSMDVGNSELNDALSAGNSVFRTRDGSWLQIDAEQVSALKRELGHLGLPPEGGVSTRFRFEAKEAVKALLNDLGAVSEGTSRSLVEDLITEPPPEEEMLSDTLATILRPYQQEGFAFLCNRIAHRVGTILADDMGLGKTLQVLAVIEARIRGHAIEGASERPRSLVVCPASVVSVWLEQSAQFCPDLRCRSYTGTASRRKAALERGDWDLLVTNYALVRNDIAELAGHTFDLVVLDEAQHIKNPESQIAQVVKTLQTRHAMALTGTPLENRLLDLWSIMDFVNPGFLGDRAAFADHYEVPQRRRELAKRIGPVLLRRTKEKVAPELPPRTEEVLRVEFDPAQRKLYDTYLLQAREAVRERGPIEVLAALTRLRQICCDPRLVPGAPPNAASAKLGTLVDLVTEIMDEGHSVLVFSQFTSMLDLIRDALGDLPTLTITGKTPTDRRAELVKEFNESDVSQAFLLSLRAAGTGLTLTKADYVVIYDPWWNPAVERQAIDRTHRIGQDKPVIAYRLVAAKTVEDKVLLLQQEKAELFADVMGEAQDARVAGKLSSEDLARLLEAD